MNHVVIIGGDLPALILNFAATSYHANTTCTVLTTCESVDAMPHVCGYQRPLGSSKALREAIELANEELGVSPITEGSETNDFRVGVMVADGTVVGLTSSTTLASLTTKGVCLSDYVERANGRKPKSSLTLSDAFPVRTCRTASISARVLAEGLREYARPIVYRSIEVQDYTILVHCLDGSTMRVPYNLILACGDELLSWELSDREPLDTHELVVRVRASHPAMNCYELVYLTNTKAALTMADGGNGELVITANVHAPWTALLADIEALFNHDYEIVSRTMLPVYSGLIGAKTRDVLRNDLDVMDLATLAQNFAGDDAL